MGEFSLVVRSLEGAESVSIILGSQTCGSLAEGASREWLVADSRGPPRGPAGRPGQSGPDLTDGLPRWHWRVGDVVLERELAMLPGRCATGVVHRLLAEVLRVHSGI